MTQTVLPYGELLQGKDGMENVIILSGDTPFQVIQQVCSDRFELEPPTPWENDWLLLPMPICKNGCDMRSFALDLRDNGINMKIPPEIPPGTPTFQDIFGT